MPAEPHAHSVLSDQVVEPSNASSKSQTLPEETPLSSNQNSSIQLTIVLAERTIEIGHAPIPTISPESVKAFMTRPPNKTQGWFTRPPKSKPDFSGSSSESTSAEAQVQAISSLALSPHHVQKISTFPENASTPLHSSNQTSLPGCSDNSTIQPNASRPVPVSPHLLRPQQPEKKFPITLSPSTSISELISQIGSTVNLGREGFKSFYNGKPLDSFDPTSTLASCSITAGAEITVNRVIKVRKPVIYLMSPSTVEASIRLSISRDWTFSVIYPEVPIERGVKGIGENITWNVIVENGGSLRDLHSDLEVSYLFWEAEVYSSTIPPSPPSSPTLNEEFHPLSATVCDANSVVLSVDRVVPYLYNALKAFGLHTEARTSFITYWLPDIRMHKYVILRLLHQDVYQRSAEMHVSPPPDVVTRIFMLFQGVTEQQLIYWPCAIARAFDGVEWWKDVVGVDSVKARDGNLFRVLEWGGMEITSEL